MILFVGTIVEFGLIVLTTTAFAPILALLPIWALPMTFAPTHCLQSWELHKTYWF